MTSSYVEPQEARDEGEWDAQGFTLRDLLEAVRRHWWIAVLVFALVVSWSMWRTLRQERLYQASTTVRIQDAQLPATAMTGAGNMTDWRVDRLLSEQQIIKSQNVAESVVRSLGLQIGIDPESKIRRGVLFDGAPPRVVGKPTATSYLLRLGPGTYEVEAGGQRYGPVAYGDSLEAGGLLLHFPRRPAVDHNEVRLWVGDTAAAAAAVRGGISTGVVPQTDIVNISYIGNDPLTVRDVTNEIAVQYAAFSAQSQKRNASQKTQFIGARLDEQEHRLRQAQDSLKDFQERNQTADVSAEQLAIAGNIAKLEQEKQEVVVEQNIYEHLVGKLAAADTVDDELRRIVGTGAGEKNQSIANLFSRWFDLQKDRQLMIAAGKNENYQDVKALDQLISQTKRDLQSASRVYLQALQSRMSSIDRTIEGLRVQAERYPPLTAEQARLMANVKTSEQIYSELQSEYQRARIAEAADAGQVTIIDRAMTPNFAVSPNRRRAATTAIIFGILLGLGAAVLLDRLDTSIRSPDELGKRYDLTVLGMIPAIRLSDVNADGPSATARGRLVTHADPRSPVAEAYRSLRTNLAFARAQSDLRTLVLTSPGPADGKSTTIANLAITFSQQGQRTLVVDADLRRAVLDRTFEVPRTPGLTDVLVGRLPLDQAVHASDIPNLYVLGSGEFPPNPSELLGSDAMRKLIEDARTQFDVVLFDTPPLLAVTDAAVLSTRVDGTVLVVRMGKTAREAVRRALLALRAVHPNILGGVLNDVDFRSGSYYGGYGYYYYAYHYYSDSHRNGNGNGNGDGSLTRLGRRIRSLTKVGSGRGA